jgi:hypothetical protein
LSLLRHLDVGQHLSLEQPQTGPSGRAIVALVSDDMQFLTGPTLMLEGGQVMLR